MTTLPTATDVTDSEATTGRASSKGSTAQGIREWIYVIAGAIAVALIVKSFIVQAFYIPSASMHPTLLENDRVLVNKVSYRLHPVNRGDVIVFERPDDQQLTDTKDLIKRVVGIPGDSLVIDDKAAKLYVNGQPLDEPYLAPGTVTRNSAGPLVCTQEQPCKVPASSVFVMGDNRTNSRDSRFIGYISDDQIVGRAFVRVWPLSRLSGL